MNKNKILRNVPHQVKCSIPQSVSSVAFALGSESQVEEGKVVPDIKVEFIDIEYPNVAPDKKMALRFTVDGNELETIYMTNHEEQIKNLPTITTKRGLKFEDGSFSISEHHVSGDLSNPELINGSAILTGEMTMPATSGGNKKYKMTLNSSWDFEEIKE